MADGGGKPSPPAARLTSAGPALEEMPKLPRCKQDDEDMEKLHHAARRGNAELVARLLSQGLGVASANKFGCTALHLACRHGHAPVLRALAPHDPPLSAAWHGARPAHLAVRHGSVATLQELVALAERQSADVAALLGEADECEAAEVGAHELEEPTSSQTPVHWAIQLARPDMLAALLAHGASTTARDRLGRTALICALDAGQQDMARGLLDRRPGLRIQDKRGRSALHWALDRGFTQLAEEIVAREVAELGEAKDGAFSPLLIAEDDARRSPLSLAVQLSEAGLVAAMLPRVDPFQMQKQDFHDARTVVDERIEWCDEPREPDAKKRQERRDAVVKLLQLRLDEVNAAGEESRGGGRRAGRGAAGTGGPSPGGPGRRR